MRAEFKRAKHGQIPSDVGRNFRISMREKRIPMDLAMGRVIGDKCAKGFRQDLVVKSKTVQRRRDKKAIKSGLEE